MNEINIEEKQAQLDSLYANVYLADIKIARPGGYWIGIIPTTILMLFLKENIDFMVVAVLSLFSIYSFIVFVKYTKIYKNSKAKIFVLENELENNTELRYCGCSHPSHLYNSSSEQYWNLKHKILFDQHSNELYIKWHERWHNEPGLKRMALLLTIGIISFIVLFVLILIVSAIST